MPTCSVKDCTKAARKKGWCYQHYGRWFRHGDVTYNKRPRLGTGSILPNGYKKLSIEGRSIMEHRFVMEGILGRRLKTNEHVHHLDRNKLNNAPENLIVMDATEHMKGHHSTTFRNDTHKQCTVCRQIKPRSMFYVVSIQNSGPTRDPQEPQCKACRGFAQAKRLANRKGHTVQQGE